MKVSNPFSLNCSYFEVIDYNNGREVSNERFDIIEVDPTNLDYKYKIIIEYNITLFNKNNWIPYIKSNESVSYESPLGFHGVTKNSEFLKIWSPSSGMDLRLINLYGNDDVLRSTITLYESEIKLNQILTFTSPESNDVDEGILDIHVDEVKPHSDIFLATNLNSSKLGFSKNYECKLSKGAGVHGTTYVDRNGHMLFLGEYHE